MDSSVELNPGIGGSKIGVDLINNVAYEVVKQAFGEEGSVEMVSDVNPLPVTLNNPSTAYGELITSQDTPFIQSNGTYGFVAANFRTFTESGGSASIVSRMYTVSTGTTSLGYGAVQSFRSLNYKSGQGACIKFSAIYENNVANSWTGVGLVNISDELSFGYNGTAFGAWHRYGGDAEVRTITVTVASSGSTNLTLTLNSVIYTIPLTAGTTAHNAYQIATWLNANQTIWVCDQLDSTVIISAQSDGAKSGTYSYSHATSSGTITLNTVGVTKTSEHYPQTEWNINTFAQLDPSKLNLYKIIYDDNVNFYVADANVGGFVLVHRIMWLNSKTRVLLNNPSLRFGLYAASIGSTTNLTIKCASNYLSLQGQTFKTRNPRAVKNTQTVSNTMTNVLTLRNRRTYNSYYNQVEIDPVFLSFSSESPKNVEVELRTGATFSGDTNFTTVGTNLVGDVDVTANTISGGTLLASFTVGASGSVSINLVELQITLPPSILFTVAARVTSGAAASVTAALTYYEDL